MPLTRPPLAGALFAFLLTGAAPAGAQEVGGRIEGTVTDSVRRVALVGATVVATPAPGAGNATFHAARTDGRGRFLIAGLPAGRYDLTVEHPFIDSIAYGVPPATVTVAGEGATPVMLAIPSPRSMRRALCDAAARDSSLGVMIGIIRQPDGAPATAARVVVQWSDFEVDPRTAAARTKQVMATATTDSAGVYRACGLPVARTLYVQAQSSALESGVIEEEIAPLGLLVRDYRLSGTPVASMTGRATSPDPGAKDSVAVTGLQVVPGTVRSTTGAPIAAATVRLFGGDRRTTTDSAGAFRLTGVPGGTQGIEVLALGYYPRRVRADVGAGAAPLRVVLERAAVVLDSIRVMAKRVNNPRAISYREFDDRVGRRRGQFLTEDEIERRNAFETSDLFKMMPGVRVTGFGHDARIASLRGRTAFGTSDCTLEIFIDGVRAQPDDVNMLPPHALHGVEVYTTATAPAKYRVGNCGAILMWTK